MRPFRKTGASSGTESPENHDGFHLAMLMITGLPAGRDQKLPSQIFRSPDIAYEGALPCPLIPEIES